MELTSASWASRSGRRDLLTLRAAILDGRLRGGSACRPRAGGPLSVCADGIACDRRRLARRRVRMFVTRHRLPETRRPKTIGALVAARSGRVALPSGSGSRPVRLRIGSGRAALSYQTWRVLMAATACRRGLGHYGAPPATACARRLLAAPRTRESVTLTNLSLNESAGGRCIACPAGAGGTRRCRGSHIHRATALRVPLRAGDRYPADTMGSC
jgi:hypothetical protein